MRSLVKVVIATFVVLFVASQFMPDVIQVPNHWPPRLPKIEFVHAGIDVGQPVAAGIAADSLAGRLPAIAAAPSIDAAQEARKQKRTESAPRKKAKRPAPKPAREDDSEAASWFGSAPAMIVPVRITTEVQLSKRADREAESRVAEPATGEDWPVVCGVVVDTFGDPVADASVQIESTDVGERTDHKGRFCLASPGRRITLRVDGGERGNVRYAAELDGRTTQVRITLR